MQSIRLPPQQRHHSVTAPPNDHVLHHRSSSATVPENHLAKWRKRANVIDDPLLFSFVMGTKYTAPATPQMVSVLASLAPAGSYWAAFGTGPQERTLRRRIADRGVEASFKLMGAFTSFIKPRILSMRL